MIINIRAPRSQTDNRCGLHHTQPRWLPSSSPAPIAGEFPTLTPKSRAFPLCSSQKLRSFGGFDQLSEEKNGVRGDPIMEFPGTGRRLPRPRHRLSPPLLVHLRLPCRQLPPSLRPPPPLPLRRPLRRSHWRQVPPAAPRCRARREGRRRAAGCEGEVPLRGRLLGRRRGGEAASERRWRRRGRWRVSV